MLLCYFVVHGSFDVIQAISGYGNYHTARLAFTETGNA